MKITEISVSYEETCSLPGYNNVRPGVRLTAQVEDEPANAVAVLLMDQARSAVREEIDFALMCAHKAPKYFDGQRYKIVYSWQRRICLVIPQEHDAPDDFSVVMAGDCDTSELLLSQAREYAERYATLRSDATCYTIVDGDYSALPELPMPIPAKSGWKDSEFEEDDEEPPF